MKKIIFALLVVALAVSCKENERLIYDNGHKLYFDIKQETPTIYQDSTNRSLLSQTEDVGIQTVTLALLGQPLAKETEFRVEVDTKLTTAVEGKHYNALKESYTFPANAVEMEFPVELIKTDQELFNKTVTLAVRLVPTDNMGIAYEERSYVRIMFDLKLTRPPGQTSGWSDMAGFYSLFGEYSQVKHAKIIELAGHDFWIDDYGHALMNGNTNDYYNGTRLMYEKDYWKPYAILLLDFYTNNVVNDENGNQILPW